MQDIFLVFFRRIPALRDPHAMKAFIVSVTLMAIRCALRRKASARMQLVAEPPETIATPADLDARQALGHLCQILDRLDPVDRSAFVLRFVEKQELSAISVALGVSVTTAKRRVARAQKRVALHSRRDAALVDYVDCFL
jgi:RNA polymerase sigma-70 factor (ECF subfamily)